MTITIGIINIWDAFTAYGISLLLISIIGVWNDREDNTEADCNIFSGSFIIGSIIMVLVFYVVSILMRNIVL